MIFVYIINEIIMEGEPDKRAGAVLKTVWSVMSWLGGRTYALRDRHKRPSDG